MADYEKIRKLLECEIDKIGSKPELNDASLANLYKLVDVMKDLGEIEKNDWEMNGMSGRTMVGYYDDGIRGNSQRGYDNRMMYNNGTSYGMGGYGGRSYGGYSMNDGSVIQHLEMAMNNAKNDRERQAIQELMNKMGNM